MKYLNLGLFLIGFLLLGIYVGTGTGANIYFAIIGGIFILVSLGLGVLIKAIDAAKNYKDS